MVEWSSVTVGEVAREVTVGHVGPMADDYERSGVPFLRSLNVEPFKLRMDNLKFISREFHCKLRKSALAPGDVVIVRTGKPGSCAVIPEYLAEANCSDLVIVRCGNRVRPHFLSYVVNSLAGHHIASHTVGAVQQHFNVGSARTLTFQLPSLGVQDAILDVLKTLDDKVELNRRMNGTLEASARALFRDWFVDFGPTRAKAGGHPAYLAPDLWSLFPDRIGDDGVPERWEWSTIGEEVEAVGGSTPSTKNAALWDGGIAWTTPKDLSDLGSPILLDTMRTITEAGLRTISSGLLPAGTVLMSSRAPVGYLAVANVPLAVNQGYIAMKCTGRVSNWSAYLWAHENMDAIISNANGSTFQEISKKNFRPLPILVADDATRFAFDGLVGPMVERITANVIESRTLAATRDALLPKLMSGELRVSDAEALAA